MKNWINSLLKKIYIYVGFRVPYHWAELLFPNRIIYAVMLMSDCYTMKQFRNKNLKLLNYINEFDEVDRHGIKSKVDLIDKIIYFNKIRQVKQDLSKEHKDRIISYIKDDLGIALE